MTTLATAMLDSFNQVKHNFALKHGLEGSPMYKQIISLDWDKFVQLSSTVEDEDDLSHVCDESFCVNSVGGSIGHRIDFY